MFLAVSVTCLSETSRRQVYKMAGNADHWCQLRVFAIFLIWSNRIFTEEVSAQTYRGSDRGDRTWSGLSTPSFRNTDKTDPYYGTHDKVSTIFIYRPYLCIRLQVILRFRVLMF